MDDPQHSQSDNEWLEFDRSLARVMMLRRDKRPGSDEPKNPSELEQAWYSFWKNHLEEFMRKGKKKARSKLPAGYEDIFESDLQAELLQAVARPHKELNRRIIAGMRDNIILRIQTRLNEQANDNRLERKLHEQLAVGHLDQSSFEELRSELNAVIAEVDGPRSTIKSRVLNAILNGPDSGSNGEQSVFKKNGEINLSGVAEYLGEPEGSVRRALHDLRHEIPSRWPQLAEYLDIRSFSSVSEFVVSQEVSTGDRA